MRLALFAIALAGAAPACAQTINDTTDRISGERTIDYTADGNRDTSRPVVTFNASVSGDTSANRISLVFASGSGEAGIPRARFASCHGIDWIVDGQPLVAASASHRARVFDGELIEMIDQDVSASWVAAIAAARNVRYRVCRDDYSLTTSDINAFGRIAAKLKSVALSSTAPSARAPETPRAPQVEYQGMSWRPKHQDMAFPSKN
ncbi:MAG: hypothetical protein ABI538_10230 [Pseudoxanthomonas sp.]